MSRAWFITGPGGGTGKTFCNVNLALFLAGQGHRVLFADLDPLSGSLAFWGKLPDTRTQETIQRYEVRAGLDLVLGLEPEETPELFQQLEGQYDVWLFDTGAALDVGLAPVYALCDRILLLLANDQQSFAQLPEFVQQLSQRQSLPPEQFAGLLVNQRECDEPVPNALPGSQLANSLLPFSLPFCRLADRALLEQQGAWEFSGSVSELGLALARLVNLLSGDTLPAPAP